MGVRFLQGFEQLILVGALPPVATFAYRNKPAIKSPANCELFGMAAVDYDLAEALRALALATRTGNASAARRSRVSPPVPAGPLTANAIGASITLLMPDDAILVDEAATNGPSIGEFTKGAAKHDYLNPVNGGAIGGGFPMALGASIACPDRKVVLLQADGSGMYGIQALWTMAREKADVVIVLLKNDRYNILELELARVREQPVNSRMDSMISLDQPSIDCIRTGRRARRARGTGGERGSVPQGLRRGSQRTRPPAD